MQFFDVLITVGALLVLMVPGYILTKCKVLPEKTDTVLTALVLYGCQPIMQFMSFQKESYDSRIAINMIIVAGISFVVHMLMIGIMMLFFRARKMETKAKINCLRFASVFPNCGYMGLPFLSFLFKGTDHLGEIIIYAGVDIAVMNLIMWSLGVLMITGDRKQMSLKRALLNPTVIALFMGIIVFFTVQTPIAQLGTGATNQILSKLMEGLNIVGDMVTPLAMILIGFKLAKVKIKDLLFDKWAYLASANKLILMSVLTMVVVAFLPISIEVKYTLFFCLSMPSATCSTMFAVQFGGDSETSAVMVLLSTVLSILTIPLMFLLFSRGFGVVI
ncbi:MAG: AEC family transporter [Clostridia bacterium]|nr:AEC family transporter [Clostridia bacterium]